MSTSSPDQTWEELRRIAVQIVNEATALKNDRTDQAKAHVSYCCVFCRDDTEFAAFVAAAKRHGDLGNDTATGPVFVVPPIDTVAGPLRIVKVRRPDATRPERGDADFAAIDYGSFKKSHLTRQGFRLIERPEFEMIELVDPGRDVRVYFSNPPVEQHSGIREALARRQT